VHMHELSLRFHLERKTGGLTRVLERGRNAIETIVRMVILQLIPTIVEVSLLLAVLEKRVGLHLGTQDVFVNIAGGVKIDEPAVDLGIAASIASSLRDIPVDSSTVAVGEIGLGGGIRTIGHVEKRIQEAAKLGFKRIVIPHNNLKGIKGQDGIDIVGVQSVNEAIQQLLG